MDILNESQVEEIFGKNVEVDPLNDEMAQVLHMLDQINNQDMKFKEQFKSFIKDDLSLIARLIGKFYLKPDPLMTRRERFDRQHNILAAVKKARLLGKKALNEKPVSYNFNRVKQEIMNELDSVIRLQEPKHKPLGSVIDHEPSNSGQFGPVMISGFE